MSSTTGHEVSLPSEGRLKGFIEQFSKFKALFIILLLSSLLFAHHRNGVLPAVDSIAMGHIAQQNQVYLAGAEEEAVETFVLLSGLKTGLSIIQSSSAGVSFIVDVQVQIGKLLESIKQIVDYAWSASLLTLGVLFGFQILISWSATLNGIGLTVFLVSFICHYLTHILLPNNHKVTMLFSKASIVSFMAFLITYAIVPLTIYTASISSEAITRPISRQVYADISRTHQDLLPNKSSDGIKAQVENSISTYRALSTSLHEKRDHLTHHIVRHIAATVFDVFVFPLTFFVLMVFFLRKFAGNLLQLD